MRHLAGMGEWRGWLEGMTTNEDEDLAGGDDGVTDCKSWLEAS